MAKISLTRLGLLGIVVVAAGLRLWAFRQPYLHAEQELIPLNALTGLVRGDWRPDIPVHGAAFLYLLRTLYAGWGMAGQLSGVWQDQLDVLASFLRDPWPFLLVGRALVVAAGLATVWLVARVGRMVGSIPGGLVGAALLAVTFVHVRQSVYLWYDVPAGLAVLGAVAAALRAQRLATVGAFIVTGALAGLAVASKHPMAPVVVPVALAVWWTARPSDRLRAMLATALPALGMYTLLCPYTILELPRFLQWTNTTAIAVVHAGAAAASLPTLIWLGLGIVTPMLAVVGVALRVRRAPRETILLAAFPIVYLAILGAAPRLHLRYLAPVAPFACLFAGLGLASVARRFGRSHGGVLLAGLTVLVAAGPCAQSMAFVRLLARDDTRLQAGRWIEANVKPGTPLEVPALNGYPNPVLPLNAELLGFQFPAWAAALRARGVGTPERSWPLRFRRGVFGDPLTDERPAASIVVTAEHPSALRESNTPREWIERLPGFGYRPVAQFRGFWEPLDAVFDPIEADYTPLARFGQVVRPGPNITIWMRGERSASPG